MKIDLSVSELAMLIQWGGDKYHGWELFKKLKDYANAANVKLTEARTLEAEMKKRANEAGLAFEKAKTELNRAQKLVDELEA